jgi:hypothetical protein
MTATTAAVNGIVSTLATAPNTPFARSYTNSLSRPAKSSGSASSPIPAATAVARMFASNRMPAVGHHRRRTRLNDRPSAPKPRVPSISSTGTATDHATYSHTPGATQAAKPSSTITPWISVNHSSEPSRRKPNRNDAAQSVSVPRYVSLTDFRHAAWASVLETMLITRIRSRAAIPTHSLSDDVVVAPAVVDVSGSDSVIRTFRTCTGTITTATALSMVANRFR